jgi:lipopolysaccharide biosynthesis glycosyltransferase
MHVVFNINQLGLEGLGATLTSLIRNCSNSGALKLCFLCNELSEKDKKNIKLLLDAENFLGVDLYIDFDANKEFGHLNSLHGDRTAYGRLLMSKFIDSDYALYLDADLVILTDVLVLKNFDFSGNLLAAVSGSVVKHALDHPLFINKLNWSPDTPYFNSGVLLFNLKKWRDENFDAQVKDLMKNYSDYLVSHDQTLLNALCGGTFSRLPKSFNVPWYPDVDKPAIESDAIIHFVGSPKPWDFLAANFHKGYGLWKSYNTASWSKEYSSLTSDKVSRFWNIRRSYLRLLKKKFKG